METPVIDKKEKALLDVPKSQIQQLVVTEMKTHLPSVEEEVMTVRVSLPNGIEIANNLEIISRFSETGAKKKELLKQIDAVLSKMTGLQLNYAVSVAYNVELEGYVPLQMDVLRSKAQSDPEGVLKVLVETIAATHKTPEPILKIDAGVNPGIEQPPER